MSYSLTVILFLVLPGNSIPDLMNNLSLARDGFPSMAVAACFAGPMFSMMVGMSSALAYGAAMNHGMLQVPVVSALQAIARCQVAAASCLQVLLLLACVLLCSGWVDALSCCLPQKQAAAVPSKSVSPLASLYVSYLVSIFNVSHSSHCWLTHACLCSVSCIGWPTAGDGWFWHCEPAQVPAGGPTGLQIQDEQEDDCHIILVLCLFQCGLWAGHCRCNQCGLAKTLVGGIGCGVGEWCE